MVSYSIAFLCLTLCNLKKAIALINLTFPLFQYPFGGGHVGITPAPIDIDAVLHVGRNGGSAGRCHLLGQGESLATETVGPGERDVVVVGAAGVVGDGPAFSAGGVA